MKNIFLLILLFALKNASFAQEKRNSPLLRFYKKNISSQDGPVCNFSPSCSEYAQEVIKKKGILMGLFYTTDRLTRCHPYHLNDYPYNPKLEKAIDKP